MTALCPGPTASGFQDAADLNESRLVTGRTLASSASVAQAGYQAMWAGKAVVIPGAGNLLMAESIRLAPRSIVRRMVRVVQAPRRTS